MQTIANSANGLLALLNNVLDNAKLESGKLRVVCEPFDLYEVVHSAAELYRAGCEMKGIDLDVAIDHDVERWYLGDGVRIRQIIQNLTHNALKFTERGQISIHVKSGDGIAITVRDTGVGMSTTDQESLFERYRQFGELDRRTTGTGLGLAISRDLVHAMGGEFTVASAEGVGSAFTMVLPLAVAEAPPEKVPTFLLIPTMSILVVEDDVVNQLVVTSMLESMGHRSHAVGTGREGVQAALSGKYQLVLMDSQLPDFDGIEATRQIRSQETGRLTIVGLTANAFRDHEIKCLEAGMDAVATKPITRESLEQSLASALQIA